MFSHAPILANIRIGSTGTVPDTPLEPSAACNDVEYSNRGTWLSSLPKDESGGTHDAYGEYLEVDFKELELVEGIKLQGFSNKCVCSTRERFSSNPDQFSIEYHDGCQWYTTENAGLTWKPAKEVTDSLRSKFSGPASFGEVSHLNEFSPFLAKKVRVIFIEYSGEFLGARLGIDVHERGQCVKL